MHVHTLPMSPAWRTASVGAPCFILAGLKWGPVDMQPLVVSPNSWMWNPWLPASRPSTRAAYSFHFLYERSHGKHW